MPETISLMKQRVLNMAIRGELVDQRPEEGTARELLQQMHESKKVLIKEKKIKNKKTQLINKNEVPFAIPDSWEWVRIDDIGTVVGGGTPKTKVSEYWEDGTVPWVSPADLTGYKDKYISKGRKNITVKGLNNSSARMLPQDSVLFSSRAPIGYVAIAKNNISTNQGFKSIVPFTSGLSDYVYYYLQAFIDDIKSRSSGTTFKEISGKKLGESLFPLPPLAEQKRIVSKIEKMFSIIEKIAERKEDTLQTLQQIRQTALREAIRGKLVEQDKNNAPASELIKQINAEKNRLIKEKLIKKGKRLPVISQDSKPFEIPENWEWIRLGEVIELISGRDLKKSEYNDASSGIPYITGASNFSQSNIIVNRWTKSPKVISQKGDLLITVKGTIGEMTIQSLAEAHIARQVMAIRNVYDLNTNYLQIFLQSRIIELKSKAKSMIPGISRDDLLNFEFPLPPINEQNRIVKKIESIEKILLEMEDRLI